MRIVTITLHLERLDTGDYSWWADSPDVAGLYSAGDTFAEAYGLAVDAIHDEFGVDVRVGIQAAADGEPVPGFADHDDAALRIPQPA